MFYHLSINALNFILYIPTPPTNKRHWLAEMCHPHLGVLSDSTMSPGGTGTCGVFVRQLLKVYDFEM